VSGARDPLDDYVLIRGTFHEFDCHKALAAAYDSDLSKDLRDGLELTRLTRLRSVYSTDEGAQLARAAGISQVEALARIERTHDDVWARLFDDRDCDLRRLDGNNTLVPVRKLSSIKPRRTQVIRLRTDAERRALAVELPQPALPLDPLITATTTSYELAATDALSAADEQRKRAERAEAELERVRSALQDLAALAPTSHD
jgi:hypothetical protein